MGMFATIHIDNSIGLPYLPNEINRDSITWQSKQGIDRYGGPYRITADGRLETKQISKRDKTDNEKQIEAEKWGYDSWEDYTDAYESKDGMYPEDINQHDDESPPTFPSPTTTDEVWWEDIEYDGIFEFHGSIMEDPIEWEEIRHPTDEEKTHQRPTEYAFKVFYQYEARFTDGDLDEIVCLGKRGGGSDNSIESIQNDIEEWREWKQQK